MIKVEFKCLGKPSEQLYLKNTEISERLKSTEVLVREGFKVMVYCSDDPIIAKKLEDLGASAIMPLASPIGSGRGIKNK